MQTRLDRDALVALLGTQPDFRVLGAAGTAGETIALCVSARPRVLVLGALLPWPPGVCGVAALRVAAPGTQILALAPHGGDRCSLLNPSDPATVEERSSPSLPATCLGEAVTRGALGALDRDAAADELFEAIRAVSRAEARNGGALDATTREERSLTRRERIVAKLVGEGCSNKDLAHALDISELTAKKHVANILHKLGLHDRLQLGLRVARHPLAFRSD